MFIQWILKISMEFCIAAGDYQVVGLSSCQHKLFGVRAVSHILYSFVGPELACEHTSPKSPKSKTLNLCLKLKNPNPKACMCSIMYRTTSEVFAIQQTV